MNRLATLVLIPALLTLGACTKSPSPAPEPAPESKAEALDEAADRVGNAAETLYDGGEQVGRGLKNVLDKNREHNADLDEAAE